MKDRRDFLMKLGFGAGVAGLATQSAASLRSLVPNVSYDAPTTVKLGLPLEFPDGLKFLPDQRLFVFRQGNVFHAISAVCTTSSSSGRCRFLPFRILVPHVKLVNNQTTKKNVIGSMIEVQPELIFLHINLEDR